MAEDKTQAADAQAPAGVNPVGTSREALEMPASVLEIRKLYSIIFGLTLGMRIFLYLMAVVAFFRMGTTWGTLGLIVLLLIGGRILAKAHSWAWRGYRDHSINSADPAMRERVLYEEEQARAGKAARTAAQHLSSFKSITADHAVQISRKEVADATQAAENRAGLAADRARNNAVKAAYDAKRIAEEARDKARKAVAQAQESAACVAQAARDAASAANASPQAEPKAAEPELTVVASDDGQDSPFEDDESVRTA